MQEPCQICGSAVRVRKQRTERSLGDSSDTTGNVRVCTNGSCVSNTGEMSLADVV